jgi:RNA polymerase sigma factor (sigma-70 family)
VATEIERLYREHRTGLVRLVERELHDHHDAEDVVQTAFLEAQRALERGTTPHNPRAWLAAIALNAGRHLRRRHLNAEPLEEQAVQEASRVPEIRAALAGLPREQRAAVVYRDVLGLSYGETAEQMGKSVNAVTMLLHRGRGQLRRTLGIAAGGFRLSRWLRQSGMPQAAFANGAATVVVAAGLATTGVVAAHVVAPIGSGMRAAAPVPHSGRRTARAERRPGRVLAPDATRHEFKAAGGSRISAIRAISASTRGSGGAATSPAVRSPTPGVASSRLPLTVRVPTVSLPTLPIPTVAARVTVSTPITAATVTIPASTTATVTTPIATVTLPIP